MVREFVHGLRITFFVGICAFWGTPDTILLDEFYEIGCDDECGIIVWR